MRNFLDWLDFWKWWIIVPLFILAVFVFVIFVINGASRQYIKCREAGRSPDICLVGG